MGALHGADAGDVDHGRARGVGPSAARPKMNPLQCLPHTRNFPYLCPPSLAIFQDDTTAFKL